ncbi:putative oxidoreductase bli-4 [Colletotrichum fructicola]|nr:putative oxidoreductase bli-4 [Colletotrichum fructicola]
MARSWGAKASGGLTRNRVAAVVFASDAESSLNTTPSPASTPEHAAQATTVFEPLPGNQATEEFDESAFTLVVQDLQLFHHFCSITSTTFGPTPHVQQFWSITVAQMSFSHPFLLRAILAIGGLHMNHLRQTSSEASGWYKTKATAHWQAAVRLATPRLAAIDAESCDPLFIFAMLSCLQTFALGPQPGNFLLFTDDSGMEWPIFFRGLRTVAEASVLFGMTEPARPLAFMYGIAKLNLETLPRDEPVTSWGTALRNLRQIMMNEVSGEEERAVYQDALYRLRAGFAAVFGDSDTVRGANSQVVFAWLYHVSEDFVGRLQARQNLALVFFAYFAVLIKQIDGVWMIKGWPDHLIAGIYHTLNTIAENFGGSTAASLGSHQFSLDDCPDLTSKIAVVTGGSEGTGYGVTHTLLKHNIAKLYILSVSKEVVEGAQDAIAKDLGTEKANRTKWFQCDMSDWKRVKEVAEAIKNDADRLDILVNNAGRGIMSFELTDYGVDRHMALNHMGHVVLTSHLLPLIKETAEKGNVVRIVNQASNAHQAAPSDVKFESLEELNKDLGPNGQYGRSKLANILYARYFARKVTQNGHPNVLMNATHPGFVSTKMSKEDIFEPYPLGGYAMAVGMEPFKKSQWEGAVSAVFAATAIKESGQYICPPAIPEAGNKLAQDEKLADQLMELTRKIITEKTRSQSVDKGCPMDDLVLH